MGVSANYLQARILFGKCTFESIEKYPDTQELYLRGVAKMPWENISLNT
jgi:hypothetical protein